MLRRRVWRRGGGGGGYFYAGDGESCFVPKCVVWVVSVKLLLHLVAFSMYNMSGYILAQIHNESVLIYSPGLSQSGSSWV